MKYKIRSFKWWIINSYHRIRYGVGYYDLYNLDYFIAKIMVHGLKNRYYVKDKGGIPASLVFKHGWSDYYFIDETHEASKEWDRIITEMIEGFEAFMDEENICKTSEEQSEMILKLNNSLDLLKKYFNDLWI